jgi:hypothetical protein
VRAFGPWSVVRGEGHTVHRAAWGVNGVWSMVHGLSSLVRGPSSVEIVARWRVSRAEWGWTALGTRIWRKPANEARICSAWRTKSVAPHPQSTCCCSCPFNSVPSVCFAVPNVVAYGRDGLSRRIRPNGPRRLPSWRRRKPAGTPPPQQSSFLRLGTRSSFRHTERIRASFAGFRQIRVPNSVPPHSARQTRHRATISMDDGPWTIDESPWTMPKQH